MKFVKITIICTVKNNDSLYHIIWGRGNINYIFIIANLYQKYNTTIFTIFARLYAFNIFNNTSSDINFISSFLSPLTFVFLQPLFWNIGNYIINFLLFDKYSLQPLQFSILSWTSLTNLEHLVNPYKY